MPARRLAAEGRDDNEVLASGQWDSVASVWIEKSPSVTLTSEVSPTSWTWNIGCSPELFKNSLTAVNA